MPEETEALKDQRERMEISVAPDDTATSRRIYSNFVAVNQSAHDFSLRFCDASPVHDIKKVIDNNGIHLAPVVAEIAIPWEIVPGLIKALQNQYDKRNTVTEKDIGEEGPE